jgi:ankyrin repeat protein
MAGHDLTFPTKGYTMMLKTLLSSLAVGALFAGAALAEAANPLMTDTFFTDKTTVAEVQAELDKGAKLDVRGAYGENPLHHAIEGHAPIDVIKLLIAKGAQVNQPAGKKGNLATLYAAYAGNLELLQVLKDAGANFMAVDDVKETALHWMAYNDHYDPEILSFLLAEGLDPNAQTQSGDTPARSVAWHQSPDAGKMLDDLVAAGSDPTGINADGQDAFMMSVSYAGGMSGMLDRFFEMSEDPMAVDNNGLSGILLASQWGIDKERLEFLKAKDFDLQVETPKGANAIILNATWGDAASMKLLTDEGFDINATDDAGNSPLLVAMVENEPTNIKAIIEAGADVTHANAKGETPLLRALARKNEDPASDGGKELVALIDLLIEKGGDLKGVDTVGATALIYAVKSGQPLARIEQIIAAGVDVNATDAEGTTALMYAAMSSHDPAVVEALIKAGADKTVKDVFDDTAAVMAADNIALKDSPVLVLLQ